MALTGHGGLEQDEPGARIDRLEKVIAQQSELLRNILLELQSTHSDVNRIYKFMLS